MSGGQKPDEFARRALNLYELTWPVVGNDLPAGAHQRILGPLERLGDPRDRPEASIQRTRRIVNVFEGVLAAQYHRDNIERIELELVRRLRNAFPDGSWPEGGSASLSLPVIDHEYIAYLFAARRTLDYLAQAVSVLFGRHAHSIKNLASDLEYGTPGQLSSQAAVVSAEVLTRFPELLTGPGAPKSERDQAAHFSPVKPASLTVIFFPGGRVGIELHDMGPGLLPALETLDPERMSRDEPALTNAIDRRLSTLHQFCGDLIDLAVEAEKQRITP